MIGIKPKFTERQLRENMKKLTDTIVEDAEQRLVFLGEKCVRHMKENAGYTVQTGNLISSSGYVLYYNGSVVAEKFDVVKQGSEGVILGKKKADELAAMYNGYVLVIVAGMYYAKFVQMKGYNVIDATLLFAEKEVPKMKKALIKQVETEAKRLGLL